MKTKINWVEINPYEEGTFPDGIQKHILLECYYNNFHNEYLVIYHPEIYVVKNFPNFKEGYREKPKVFWKNYPEKEPKEILRWSVLQID